MTKSQLVTPEILNIARSKTDAKILNYNTFSVNFEDKTSVHPCDTEFLKHPPKICDSALDLVGRTPMIKLTRLAKKYGLQCELVAKCEFLSIGGSVKDRIGKQMIEEAEHSGRLQTGHTIVEATSGNTGIGLCLAAALKGYRCLITLPEKMSQEKLNTMAALGGEIIRTPTAAAWDSIDSHIGLAVQLQQTLPNCHFLDQYSNPANPRAHYLGTAEEILYQCDDKIDVLVMTVGTGGTITGVAQKIKERTPSCRIVGVDPRGSILAVPDSLNDQGRGQSYLVEGIGYDFIPPTLHRGLVDEWVKTDDAESLRLARDLIRLEGLLVGGSSGSAIAGALQAAKNLGPSQRCVVLLPDSARNYMTKFMSDDWMIDNGFDQPLSDAPICGNQTLLDIQLPQPVIINPLNSIRAAVELMLDQSSDVAVVVDGDKPVGIVTQSIVTSSLLTGRFTMDSSVKSIMIMKFRRTKPDTLLSDVARMLNLHSFVVIVDSSDHFVSVVNHRVILKAITR